MTAVSVFFLAHSLLAFGVTFIPEFESAFISQLSCLFPVAAFYQGFNLIRYFEVQGKFHQFSSKLLQISPNSSKFIQFPQNTSKYLKFSPISFKYLQIPPMFFQIPPIILKFLQISLISSKFFQIPPNIYKFLQILSIFESGLDMEKRC